MQLQYCTTYRRSDARIACSACGYIFKPAEEKATRRRCPILNGDSKRRKKLLGDMIADGLATVGVEKMEGCGCNERQHAVNAAHEQVLRWIESLRSSP